MACQRQYYSQRGLEFLVCLSICPSVIQLFCHHTQQTSQKATPTGSAVLHWLHFKTGNFGKIAAFKSYGVLLVAGSMRYSCETKALQWNPSIVATIGERPSGLYRGVATSQGFLYDCFYSHHEASVPPTDSRKNSFTPLRGTLLYYYGRWLPTLLVGLGSKSSAHAHLVLRHPAQGRRPVTRKLVPPGPSRAEKSILVAYKPSLL